MFGIFGFEKEGVKKEKRDKFCVPFFFTFVCLQCLFYQFWIRQTDGRTNGHDSRFRGEIPS